MTRDKSGVETSGAGRAARLLEAGFCAIDLETTGLASVSRIVEVGAVRFKLGEEGESFQTLVDPGCSIPRGAMSVHGITDEMVAGAPRAPEVLRRLLEFAADRVLVAHNARYDTSILSTELARAGMRFPPNHVVCTIKASKRFLPAMPNYRLQTIVSVLAIEQGESHRALSDARAARVIFEKAVTAEPSWRDRRLSDVLDVCSSPRLGSQDGIEARVPPELEEVRVAIDEAVDRGSSVMMMYSGGGRPPRPIEVRPSCVFSVRGGHFMEADCGDGYTRSFRLDRILRIVNLE